MITSALGKTVRANLGAAALLLAVSGAAGTANAEVQLSFYTGTQTAPHSIIDDSVLGEGRVKWLGKSFEAPPYYGIRATWWKNEKWGFGFEVNHAKVYADNKAALGYDTLEFTDGLNLITANVFRRFPNEGRFTPYVGGGLGIAVPHVEIERAGESKTFEYQLTGPAAILVAGVSYEFNDRWSVFGEYKGSYSINKAKVDAGGTLSTNIVTNALNIGVSYSF
jgi:lipid A oxidase